jgi:hypothetical protein
MLTHPIPSRAGFYWAQWRILEEDSSTETVPPIGTWEVVKVFIDSPSVAGCLRVFVAGEVRAQSLENFVWGPGPLRKPGR